MERHSNVATLKAAVWRGSRMGGSEGSGPRDSALNDESENDFGTGSEDSRPVAKHAHSYDREGYVRGHPGAIFNSRRTGVALEGQRSRAARSRGRTRELYGCDPTVWHPRVCPSSEARAKIKSVNVTCAGKTKRIVSRIH